MKKIVSLLFMSMVAVAVHAEADPNFYIYLCFGQSNMEGNAAAESVDKTGVDKRFRLLATCNYDNPKRTLGEWYDAIPPLVNPIGGLGPSDYFGRTMVAALPANIKVGVVPVAIGGCRIQMFDKDLYKSEVNKPGDWSASIANNHYGGNPYQRLIDMAKKAQEVGVIKGILLHQGCSNNGDPNWPSMVKTIYLNILKELGLKAKDVPLFAGETEYADMGGSCYAHNTVVANIPKTLTFNGNVCGYVVSAYGLPGNGTDPWHFSAAGYRTLGKRYAYEVLRAMGMEPKVDADYQMTTNLKKFYMVKSFDTMLSAKAGSTVTLKLMATFFDGHKEDLTREATFSSTDFTITTSGKDKRVKLGAEGTSGTVEAVYTDFLGTVHTVTLTVATPTAITTPIAPFHTPLWTPVYTLQGIKAGYMEQWDSLPQGLYIVKGKKIVKP